MLPGQKSERQLRLGELQSRLGKKQLLLSKEVHNRERKLRNVEVLLQKIKDDESIRLVKTGLFTEDGTIVGMPRVVFFKSAETEISTLTDEIYHIKQRVLGVVRELYSEHAPHVQRVWRGHRARKRVKVLFSAKRSRIAATHIQRTFRGFKGRRDAHESRDHMLRVKWNNKNKRANTAAAKIQSLVKGRAARRWFAVEKGKIQQRRIERCAVKIQAVIRGFLDRCKLRHTRLRKNLHPRVADLVDRFLHRGLLWEFLYAVSEDYKQFDARAMNEEALASTFIDDVLTNAERKERTAWSAWSAVKAASKEQKKRVGRTMKRPCNAVKRGQVLDMSTPPIGCEKADLLKPLTAKRFNQSPLEQFLPIGSLIRDSVQWSSCMEDLLIQAALRLYIPPFLDNITDGEHAFRLFLKANPDQQKLSWYRGAQVMMTPMAKTLRKKGYKTVGDVRHCPLQDLQLEPQELVDKVSELLVALEAQLQNLCPRQLRHSFEFPPPNAFRPVLKKVPKQRKKRLHLPREARQPALTRDTGQEAKQEPNPHAVRHLREQLLDYVDKIELADPVEKLVRNAAVVSPPADFRDFLQLLMSVPDDELDRRRAVVQHRLAETVGFAATFVHLVRERMGPTVEHVLQCSTPFAVIGIPVALAAELERARDFLLKKYEQEPLYPAMLQQRLDPALSAESPPPVTMSMQPMPDFEGVQEFPSILSAESLEEMLLTEVRQPHAQWAPPSQPSPQRPVYVCPVPGCGRVFRRPFTLRQHVRTHQFSHAKVYFSGLTGLSGVAGRLLDVSLKSSPLQPCMTVEGGLPAPLNGPMWPEQGPSVDPTLIEQLKLPITR